MHPRLQQWFQLWSIMCPDFQDWEFWMPLSGWLKVLKVVKEFDQYLSRKNAHWDVLVRVMTAICRRKTLFWHFILVLLDQSPLFSFNQMVSSLIANQLSQLWIIFKAESMKTFIFKWMMIQKSMALARLHWMVNCLFLEVSINQNRFYNNIIWKYQNLI